MVGTIGISCVCVPFANVSLQTASDILACAPISTSAVILLPTNLSSMCGHWQMPSSQIGTGKFLPLVPSLNFDFVTEMPMINFNIIRLLVLDSAVRDVSASTLRRTSFPSAEFDSRYLLRSCVVWWRGLGIELGSGVQRLIAARSPAPDLKILLLGLAILMTSVVVIVISVSAEWWLVLPVAVIVILARLNGEWLRRIGPLLWWWHLL